VDIKTQRNMVAILRILKEAGSPVGSERIAEELRLSGTELSERTVRNYLAQADALGWTENLGRRGRRLTALGAKEVDGALVIDKVGFVAARVDELAYRMTFDPATRKGKVILNISTVAREDTRPAVTALSEVFRANLGMGRLVALASEGQQMGEFRVPRGCTAIGTICSVSINGIFLRASIATTSRFGGLLELEKGEPKRFTQIINYDGSSLDPLEIFIRGYMTSVAQAAQTGSGIIGASFREVPVVALAEVRRLAALSEKLGVGGLLAIGRPNQPLLDVPVAQGRVGLVVRGGLNPVAAVVEQGIATTNAAMSTLCEFSELVDYTELETRLPPP
jgi:repressor of nif and glnA expression